MVQNPFAPLFNTARQLNEQGNLSVRALSDSLTQGANTLLASLSTGIPGVPGAPAAGAAAGGLQLPPLPGLPGFGGLGGSSHTPEHRAQQARARGNPNGIGGVPSLQQLLPAGAVQAFTQVDDVIFPRGFPSPLRLLTGATAPAAPAAPMAPVTEPIANRGAIGVEGAPRGIATRRVGRAIGVAAT